MYNARVHAILPDANEVDSLQINICEMYVEPLRFAKNIQSLTNNANDGHG